MIGVVRGNPRSEFTDGLLHCTEIDIGLDRVIDSQIPCHIRLWSLLIELFITKSTDDRCEPAVCISLAPLFTR
jgi:hypothetical protein